MTGTDWTDLVRSELREILGSGAHDSARPEQKGPYWAFVEKLERAVISEALGRSGGNQIRAARLLGINRNTLRKKLVDLGLLAVDVPSDTTRDEAGEGVSALSAAERAVRLARVRGIYPLADDDPRWRHAPLAVVEAALRGGASVLQLRLKHTRDGAALALARAALARTQPAGALLFVNDRFDLADLAGADGVHLGHEDLAPEDLPAAVRGRLLVGLSTHTLEQVRASRARPVDYVAFGPVFGTTSKQSEFTARGAPLLAEAVKLAGRPLVAIGGITHANLGEVRATGAAAAALISQIADAPDAAAATAALQQEFER